MKKLVVIVLFLTLAIIFTGCQGVQISQITDNINAAQEGFQSFVTDVQSMTSAIPSPPVLDLPSAQPSATTSAAPTPSIAPTAAPTASASAVPTVAPTATPQPVKTVSPSASAGAAPSVTPGASIAPSAEPSATPSASIAPSAEPSAAPSASPSAGPTVQPKPGASASVAPVDPAAPADPNEYLLIDNVKIVPVVGDKIFRGQILIRGGQIEQIGLDLQVPAGAKVFDATGMTAYPGIIDAHSHLGMPPVTAENAAFAPFLRAIDGFDLSDALVREAAKSGITTICVGPTTDETVGGQFLITKTMGADVDAAAIVSPYAVEVLFSSDEVSANTRMANAAQLRQALSQARSYMNNNQTGDLLMDALATVLRRETPLKINAYHRADMLNAMRIAKEFNIRFTLDDCSQAGQLINQIQNSGTEGVLLTSMPQNGTDAILTDEDIRTAKALERAVIPFAFTSGAYEYPATSALQCAIYAATLGLDEQTALEAITIHPATILGVSNRVGSLEAGKDADILLVGGNGNLLDAQNKIEAVFIGGVLVQ